MVSHGRVSCVVLLLPALLAGSTDAQTPTLAEVMRRVHEYVSVYEDHELSTVIARERYHQELSHGSERKAERTMLSNYLLFQLPDEDWVALRDTYEIDGEAVPNRGDKLKELLAGPREQLGERAMKMAEESAKLNLAGDLYYRTINLPTFALRVLRPAHRKHIQFEKAGEETINGAATWVITYEEIKGPTFSGMPNGTDVPASGRFWVDPTTGVVVQTEMILGGTRRVPARATITVTYRLEPSLGFRIPVEMRERYDYPRQNQDVVTAVANYSDFRRFDWRTAGASKLVSNGQ